MWRVQRSAVTIGVGREGGRSCPFKRPYVVRKQPPPGDPSTSSKRTVTLPNFVVTALREALELGLDGGPDNLVFPTSTGKPRSPSNVRTQLKHAQAGTGLNVRPHDFRRTVGTAVANSTSIANASAQLGHAGEATTRLHYVKRNRVAPDLREVIDHLVTQAAADLLAERKKQ